MTTLLEEGSMAANAASRNAGGPVASAEQVVSAAWIAALDAELLRRQTDVRVLLHMRGMAAEALRAAQTSGRPAAIVAEHGKLELADRDLAAGRAAVEAARRLLVHELALHGVERGAAAQGDAGPRQPRVV